MERRGMSWDLLGIGTERKMGEVGMDHGKNRKARRRFVTAIGDEIRRNRSNGAITRLRSWESGKR